MTALKTRTQTFDDSLILLMLLFPNHYVLIENRAFAE